MMDVALLETVEIVPLVVWGLFATALLTLTMAVSQQTGWSRISIPFMLGTMFSPRRSRAMAVGFVLHFALGCAFALLYVLAFESLGQATWWLGALFGAFHGAFMLVVGVPFIASIHPRMASKHHGPMPTRQLEPPGFLALHYGRSAPLVVLVSHILFGIVLGVGYTL